MYMFGYRYLGDGTPISVKFAVMVGGLHIDP